MASKTVIKCMGTNKKTNKDKEEAKSKVLSPDSIPEPVINQIKEFTKGFILFTVNYNGEPSVEVGFDDSFTTLGLIEFARMWAENQSELNQDMLSGEMNEED